MIIELSDFFNNPSLVELGPVKIQYYAVTWLLSAVLIYSFLKRNKIIHEIGLRLLHNLIFYHMLGVYKISYCFLEKNLPNLQIP